MRRMGESKIAATHDKHSHTHKHDSMCKKCRTRVHMYMHVIYNMNAWFGECGLHGAISIAHVFEWMLMCSRMCDACGSGLVIFTKQHRHAAAALLITISNSRNPLPSQSTVLRADFLCRRAQTTNHPANTHHPQIHPAQTRSRVCMLTSHAHASSCRCTRTRRRMHAVKSTCWMGAS